MYFSDYVCVRTERGDFYSVFPDQASVVFQAKIED